MRENKTILSWDVSRLNNKKSTSGINSCWSQRFWRKWLKHYWYVIWEKTRFSLNGELKKLRQMYNFQENWHCGNKLLLMPLFDKAHFIIIVSFLDLYMHVGKGFEHIEDAKDFL